MKNLCNAAQPDKPCAHCIRYTGHAGPHQTFVAEWYAGAIKARRRNAPVAKLFSTAASTYSHSNQAFARSGTVLNRQTQPRFGVQNIQATNNASASSRIGQAVVQETNRLYHSIASLH